jgi:Tfp pilus assembly protein PilF
LLLELNRPEDARGQFQQALKRTPGRPRAICGLAQAEQAVGDPEAARQHYQEFLALWQNADSDRPELAVAKKFLAMHQ